MFTYAALDHSTWNDPFTSAHQHYTHPKAGSQTGGLRGHFVRPAMLFRNFQMFNIYVAKCLETRCREIHEPKRWVIPNVVFILAIVLQTKIPLSSKFLRNLGSMPKTFTHVLLTSRKHTIGFLMKSFGECCGSTVLATACYWSSSRCIPAQKFVSVSGKLTHNRSRLVLVSDKDAWCHYFSLQ